MKILGVSLPKKCDDKNIKHIFFVVIIIFFFNTSKYYYSNKNIDTKNYNRNNINEIINSKINHLPVLKNDTDKAIQYNDGFSNELNNEKPRSFWNLLKPQ